ncbi:MAG: hypothetical protein ABEJ95_06640 [Candidatus Nanohalobium sp.]
MGYYDSVKDSVKEENQNSGKSGSNGSGPSFDTLRESAEENTQSDEEKGDDTPIEVLEEDGLQRSKPSSSREKSETGSSDNSNPLTGSEDGSRGSAVEEKLDRIIEQNQRMIEILESFGN